MSKADRVGKTSYEVFFGDSRVGIEDFLSEKRVIPLVLIPELQPAAFLSGLGIFLQAVLQGGVELFEK